MACTVTRAMLLSGCSRVRSTPEVWPWNLKRQERGVLGAEAVARQPRPDAPAGAELRHLLEEADGDVEEEREARQHLVRDPSRAPGSRWRTGWPTTSVSPIASAGVAPACCMCWPTIDSGFHCGNRAGGQRRCDRAARAARPAGASAEEHVIGDEVREVIRLVRCAGDALPGDAAALGDRQLEGQQRER